MKMITWALAASAVAVASSTAMAAPAKWHGYHKPYHHVSNVTPAERAAIARSLAHLNAVKRRAYADGRITLAERVRIRIAQARYNSVVAWARRS